VSGVKAVAEGIEGDISPSYRKTDAEIEDRFYFFSCEEKCITNT
jgi:hypothetical protein